MSEIQLIKHDIFNNILAKIDDDNPFLIASIITSEFSKVLYTIYKMDCTLSEKIRTLADIFFTVINDVANYVEITESDREKITDDIRKMTVDMQNNKLLLEN